jgi:hypothetical protein
MVEGGFATAADRKLQRNGAGALNGERVVILSGRTAIGARATARREMAESLTLIEKLQVKLQQQTIKEDKRLL